MTGTASLFYKANARPIAEESNSNPSLLTSKSSSEIFSLDFSLFFKYVNILKFNLVVLRHFCQHGS